MYFIAFIMSLVFVGVFVKQLYKTNPTQDNDFHFEVICSFGVILLALLQLYLLGIIWAVIVSTHMTINIRKTFRKHFG